MLLASGRTKGKPLSSDSWALLAMMLVRSEPQEKHMGLASPHMVQDVQEPTCARTYMVLAEAGKPMLVRGRKSCLTRKTPHWNLRFLQQQPWVAGSPSQPTSKVLTDGAAVSLASKSSRTVTSKGGRQCTSAFFRQSPGRRGGTPVAYPSMLQCQPQKQRLQAEAGGLRPSPVNWRETLLPCFLLGKVATPQVGEAPRKKVLPENQGWSLLFEGFLLLFGVLFGILGVLSSRSIL